MNEVQNQATTKLFENIQTTPEDAARNIEGAQYHEINPDTFASNKEVLAPEVEAIKKAPNDMGEATRNFIAQSEQHRALASEDLGLLDTIEKRATNYGARLFDIPNLRRQSNELWNKKITDGFLSEQDQENLDDLDWQIGELEKSTSELDGKVENLLLDVGVGVGDIFRSYRDNWEILAGTTAAGAAAGGLATLGIPIPGARVVGVSAGVSSGFATGSAIVGFLDGYKQMRAETYKELTFATNDQGEQLNLDDQTKRQAALGVGLVAGIAQGVAGKVLAQQNPIFKRFFSAKAATKYLTSSPAVVANMKILGSMAKSAFAEGGEEAVSELAQIIGVNFAKMDDSEASFLNALESSANVENLKRITYSATVGGLTGSTFAAAGGVVSRNRIRDQIAQSQEIAQKRQKVLSKQNSLIETAELMNKAKMSEVAPEQMSTFKKFLYEKIGIDEEVWFTLEDVQEFAGEDAERAEALRNAIDPTGELNRMSQELNTPLKLQESEALDVVRKFPEFTDYLRLEPQGERPIDARNEVQEFLNRQDQAVARRAEILESLGDDQQMSVEQVAELDLILNPETPAADIDNEIDYLEADRITPIEFENAEGQMESIISEREADELNTMMIDIKREVSQSLKTDVDGKFDRIEKKIFRDVNTKDLQADIKRIEGELRILNMFTDKPDLSEATMELTKTHKRKGYGPLAIDPRSLSPELTNLYLDNEDVKKTFNRRKAFVDGGIHIDEAVALTGLESPEQLLDILSETPTINELKNMREQRKIALQNRVSQTLKPSREAARDAAFTKGTTLALRQMKTLAGREYATLKRGIIKISRNPPKIEALNRDAVNMIRATKLKDLNSNRFATGERQSRAKAMKDMLDTKFESAYKNFEATARNIELRKEAIKAEESVARNRKFWKDVKSKGNQEALKKAGYLGAMEEFTNFWNMGDKVNRGKQKEITNFTKFIRNQNDDAKFIPAIPNRLDDVRIAPEDMTYEQYSTISEMGRYILKQAKLKNKLLTARNKKNELQTAELIADQIEEYLQQDPRYDLAKAKEVDKRTATIEDNIKNIGVMPLTVINTVKTSINELDGFKLGGRMQELIGDRIKESRTRKRLEIAEIEKSDKAIAEAYGMEEFKKMFNTFVEIPEFKNRLDLGDGNGKIRKIDLLTMMAYMGDPDGRKSLENFKDVNGEILSIETVMEVLDRELTEKDASLVQSMMLDRFKKFEQRSFELHERTTGTAPRMVKGIPFVHKGKEYPGGYYPIRRKRLSDDERARQYQDEFEKLQLDYSGEGDSKLFAKMRSAEMTEQGRLKERTGSQRPLDISFDNMFEFTEEAVHDLNFRETGIDAMKILKNPRNVENMKAILGPEKFGNFLEGVKDIISKESDTYRSPIFRKEVAFFANMIDKMHSLHAIKAIGFNVKSALIQPEAMLNLSLRLGPKSLMHVGSTAKFIVSNIDKYSEIEALAAEFNPDILLDKDQIDNAIERQSNDWLPATATFFKGYQTKGATALSRISDTKKKFTDGAFAMVREGDRVNKVITTISVAKTFLNGDIKGFPIEKVQAMSEAERMNKMKSIINQAVDLTLTASATEDKTALEKNAYSRLFIRYWTDRRNRLNSMVAVATQAKTAAKQGNYGEMGGHLLNMSFVSGIGLGYMSLIRNGIGEIYDQIKGIDDEDEALEFAGETAWNFATAPFEQLADLTPFIDNINYAANLDTRSDYRNVSIPLMGVMSDVAMAKNALGDILYAARKLKKPQLSRVDKKSLLSVSGYALGGMPTNMAWKLMEFDRSPEGRKAGKFLKDTKRRLTNEIDLFIETFSDEPQAEQFIEDLKEYKETELIEEGREPQSYTPEDAMEVNVRGEWNFYNPETDEAGKYGFTEERWQEIMEAAPSLGITEDGRYSKDTSEQDSAMEWSTQDNIRTLLGYEIPINNETLMGAHRFGADNYVQIHQEGKIPEDPRLKDFKSIEEINSYLRKEVKNNKQIDN